MALSGGFPGSTEVNNLSANEGDARDVGLTPGSGRARGVGNGNPLQYSCLENSMDRGAWQAIVHGVAKRWTQLSTHTQFLGNIPLFRSQKCHLVILL